MNDNEDWLRHVTALGQVDELRGRVAELEADLAAFRARAVPEGPDGWEVTEVAKGPEGWRIQQAERDEGIVWCPWDKSGLWHWASWPAEGTAPTLEAACAAADAVLGVARG